MAIRSVLCIGIILTSLLSCSKRILPINNIAKGSLDFEPIKDILIHEATFSTGPCEPSICINPNNTNEIIAASVLDNVYISKDAGQSWSTKKLTSTFGVYGDPVVRINGNGSWLFAHLSNPKGKAYASEEFLDRIVVQSSDNLGTTWTNGSYPKASLSKDHDKHWLAAEPNSGVVLMSWTEFDKYGSEDSLSKSRILFSKSTDGGLSWSEAICISEYEGDCLDDDMTTEGAHPAIGVDGTYYVTWSYNSKIYLDISLDKGLTWLSKDLVVTDQPGGWSFDIPGIGRCNGMPVMDVDYSQGKFNGRLYISWSDQRNGVNDTDIWIKYSDDNAKSWSSATRVNTDKAGKQQFFSWMDIDQTTGYVYLVFYDRRAYDDNKTDVYLAYSTDGGLHFDNIKISENYFEPENTVFFGDYNDISAHNGIIRPIWTRQDNFKLSVHTAIINVLK